MPHVEIIFNQLQKVLCTDSVKVKKHLDNFEAAIQGIREQMGSIIDNIQGKINTSQEETGEPIRKKARIEENSRKREALEICEAVLLQIKTRGHNEASRSANRGDYMDLLHFLAKYDDTLKHHFIDSTTFRETGVSVYAEDEPLVEPGTSQILIPPKRSLVNIFDDIVQCPKQKFILNKKKREYTPSVITCDRWVDYYELKEQQNIGKEKLKEEHKKEREVKRTLKENKLKQKEKKNVKNSKKQKIFNDTSSKEKGEWEESKSSIEDVDIFECQIAKIELLPVENLKVKEFILAKFKRTSRTYKYVATILKI
ncbi:unnamed protein product [Psylliodes chrysocephalus]|uniref:Uncharacterized protein n=1 Tax=Psylliodes chrysocephalus TaxID=3402493 RepID=A0A9P0DBD3_9CUCU|nr:unnamed protein product [Psylliodes chrysocephala]